MNILLTINNLSYRDDSTNKDILKGINLEIYKGEYLTLVGNNGAGKSTLAQFILGLRKSDIGQIEYMNKNYHSGYIFQNPENNFVEPIVYDDLSFGVENIGIEKSEIKRRIKLISKDFNIEDLLERQIHTLSGGQKQRVAIAGVVLMNPTLIIFDEVTSMLDQLNKKQVLNTIRKLNENGITIISITHDLDEALDSQRVIVLNDGKIQKDGNPMEIFLQDDFSNKNILPYRLQVKKNIYEIFGNNTSKIFSLRKMVNEIENSI